MAIQVKQLREHFQSISYKADQVAFVFYDTLFQRYPQVRPLFSSVRMEEQRKKLIHSLAVVIRNLEAPDFLQPYLQGLGLSHVAYGAQEGHYDAVGECLLHALSEVTGKDWTEDLEAAWVEAYGAVAQMMKQGAAKADRQADAA